jgi:hypothetical protein
MSAPRIPRRAIAIATAATAAVSAAAGVLFSLGGPAAADPPAVDFDPCVNTLDRAGQWPGALDDGSRLFSDGFDSYLSRQPACSPVP